MLDGRLKAIYSLPPLLGGIQLPPLLDSVPLPPLVLPSLKRGRPWVV